MSRARVIAGRALVIAALIAGGVSYELLNRPLGRVHVLATPLDAALPFVPLFAVPYLLYLPFVLFTFVLLAVTNWKRFSVLAVAAIITFFVADLCYSFFQTYVARPAVLGTDFASQLVRYVYASDQPYNDFPSLHTAGSALCAIAYFRWRRLYGLLALPLVLAIIVSTVLIRQHYLADVAGGLILAGVAYWIAARFVIPATQRAGVDPAPAPAETTVSTPVSRDDPPMSR
jgi:membrane-associated phospholipid phosphatase